jgi:hypothetical protein
MNEEAGGVEINTEGRPFVGTASCLISRAWVDWDAMVEMLVHDTHYVYFPFPIRFADACMDMYLMYIQH